MATTLFEKNQKTLDDETDLEIFDHVQTLGYLPVTNENDTKTVEFKRPANLK